MQMSYWYPQVTVTIMCELEIIFLSLPKNVLCVSRRLLFLYGRSMLIVI